MISLGFHTLRENLKKLEPEPWFAKKLCQYHISCLESDDSTRPTLASFPLELNF
jgi:hypothetical protein